MLELRLLNYFLTLSEELHYTKAAERLHISQPTLSNQIKILENIIGAKLFEHISKKTILTKEGKILQDSTYKLFADIEATKSAIKSYSNKSRTEIRIGSSGSHLILMPCSEFNKINKNISITMEEHSSKSIINRVKNGDLDLGIVYSSVEDPSLHSEILSLETYFAVSLSTSELSNFNSIELENLKNLPIVLLTKSSALRKNIDKAFKFINHTCNPIIQVTNLNSCITLIENSDNISILPLSYLKSIKNTNFKAIPISDYLPRQTINLIYRKDLFLDPILINLLDIIKKFYTKTKI